MVITFTASMLSLMITCLLYTSFFCTCGVGFDAFVSLQFSKAGRRGPLTYLEKTLLESLKYRPEDVYKRQVLRWLLPRLQTQQDKDIVHKDLLNEQGQMHDKYIENSYIEFQTELVRFRDMDEAK